MPDWERQTLPHPPVHGTNIRPPGELEISLALANRIAVRHFNGLRSEIPNFIFARKKSVHQALKESP